MFHLFTSTPTNIFAKMNSETMMKKQLVDILTHKNWREWFQLIELYFTGEELDFVLHQTEEEYCAVLGFTVQSGESTSANTPITVGILASHMARLPVTQLACRNMRASQIG